MRRGAVLVALVLALVGCSQNPRHNYAVASQTVGASLFAIQDAEMAAFTTRRCPDGIASNTCITLEQHQGFNRVLVTALELGRSFNTAVRSWESGTPPPIELPQIKDAISQLAAFLARTYPPELQVEIQKTITASYDAIIAVLLAGGSR
ncbi:MAG: hypothetical protein KKD01_20245 [Proteobacteria bacterium]|nr:hypothetical protein [Pseudomonadota bacterium]